MEGAAGATALRFPTFSKTSKKASVAEDDDEAGLEEERVRRQSRAQVARHLVSYREDLGFSPHVIWEPLGGFEQKGDRV